MARRITSATSLDTLKKEAKRWLRALRAGDSASRARLERANPGAPASPLLRDVQHALAREYGHESWIALTQALDGREGAEPAAVEYERVAHDLLLAFNSRDDAALQRLNARRGTS